MKRKCIFTDTERRDKEKQEQPTMLSYMDVQSNLPVNINRTQQHTTTSFRAFFELPPYATVVHGWNNKLQAIYWQSGTSQSCRCVARSIAICDASSCLSQTPPHQRPGPVDSHSCFSQQLLQQGWVVQGLVRNSPIATYIF